MAPLSSDSGALIGTLRGPVFGNIAGASEGRPMAQRSGTPATADVTGGPTFQATGLPGAGGGRFNMLGCELIWDSGLACAWDAPVSGLPS